MYARWVDLQVNGYAGVDFNAPGLTPEAVRAVTERLAADGTAAFLPRYARYARHAPNLVSARAAGAALLGSIDTSWTIRLVPKRLQLPLFAADPAAALAREMTPATAARAADIVWGVFGLEGGGA